MSQSVEQLRSWSQAHEIKPLIGLHAGHGAYLKKKIVPYLGSFFFFLKFYLFSCLFRKREQGGWTEGEREFQADSMLRMTQGFISGP